MFQPGYVKMLPKPTKIDFDNIIFCEEHIFVKSNGKSKCIGIRQSIVKVVGAGIPGSAKINVIQSSGVNPFPVGSSFDMQIPLLLQGYECSKHFNNGELKLKAGGHLEGYKNGKKVILDHAEEGGIGKGASHEEGGIKGAVGTNEKPIEFEGQEIILTAPVSTNGKKYNFEGQELTGKEIASRINQDNGGVSFERGGQTCSCKH